MDKRKKPSRPPAAVKRHRAPVTAAPDVNPAASIVQALHASREEAHPPVPEALAAPTEHPPEAFHPEDISQAALLTAVAEAAREGADARHGDAVARPSPPRDEPAPTRPATVAPPSPETTARPASLAGPASLFALQSSMFHLYRQAAMSSVSFWTTVLLPGQPNSSARNGSER